LKKKEKESEIKEMQDEMEQLKKQRVDEVNKEYDDKRKALMAAQRERQIQEASQKLVQKK